MKTRTILGTAVASALCLVGWAQAQKNWKDRAEYDLVQPLSQPATPPQKKLEILDQWKAKYPESEFKIERLQGYITTYQQLGKAPEMLNSAKELAAVDPKGILGPYWITLLTVSMGNNAPDALDAGEKAANSLIANLETKPAAVSDADWATQKTDLASKAYTTLGWAAMQRKNYDEAEKNFIKTLQLTPNNAQISYWMGTVLLAEKKPEKQAPALYHFARASQVEGPTALPDAAKTQVTQYLDRIYGQYHGDSSGLAELKAAAKANPMPPADFKIKNANEIAIEKEEEFKKSNPQLAIWMGVKKELTGAGGAQYFEEHIKNAALPKLKGKVISQKPATNPKEIVVGLADATTPEVTLKIAEGGALRGAAPVGTELEFEGVPVEFAGDPFNVTMEVPKDKITGWPATAAAAPAAKKAGGAKKAVSKKKK